MKKIFLALVIIVIVFVATFFLNSDFKNLVINVGASTSKQEVLHQLGKDAPPVMHVTHRIPSFEKNDKTILNNYELMIINTNNQNSIYELKIKNNKFSHSIETNIYVASHETKKIPFSIYIPIKLNTNSRGIEGLEINVIDKNNPTLIAKENVGFILKSI
ncbi:FixG Ig-like domain-containing protein [Sulfurimonas sp.]|uniref:FixG Ig-like domain-containing protein n=1 Tax=Sulfurimonas sp. TaxID=2022749 RepID=UPI0035614230